MFRKAVSGNVEPMSKDESDERAQNARNLSTAKSRLDFAAQRINDPEGTPKYAQFGKLGGAHRAED